MVNGSLLLPPRSQTARLPALPARMGAPWANPAGAPDRRHRPRPPRVGRVSATCLSAIGHGFASVMTVGPLETDGKPPADHDYNLATTAKAAAFAHALGVSVEGELG